MIITKEREMDGWMESEKFKRYQIERLLDRIIMELREK